MEVLDKDGNVIYSDDKEYRKIIRHNRLVEIGSTITAATIVFGRYALIGALVGLATTAVAKYIKQ